jgi:hypothetical protein
VDYLNGQCDWRIGENAWRTRDNAIPSRVGMMSRMSTYLIICGTAGLLLAIPCAAWAADAADRYITKRRRERELNELRRHARVSWERTLTYLQSEGTDRRVRGRRLDAGGATHVGARGKAHGAQRKALAT